MSSVGSIVVVVAALVGAPAQPRVAAPRPDVSLGVGWTVAQVRASVDAAHVASDDRDHASSTPATAATSVAPASAAPAAPEGSAASPGVAPPSPRISVRPYAHHSDVDARIKEARRARALKVGAALAVQGAMLIYGITRAIDQAKEAEIVRDAPPPSQFKPMHPR